MPVRLEARRLRGIGRGAVSRSGTDGNRREAPCAVSSSPGSGSSRRWVRMSRRLWANILAGKSGAGADHALRSRPTMKCRIACEVKPKDHEYGFDPGKRVDHKVQRQVDPFIIYGIDAAGQALEDAGLTEMSLEAERFPRRLFDRRGHRRAAGDRERVDRAAREGAAPRLPAFRARPPHQPDLGPGERSNTG